MRILSLCLCALLGTALAHAVPSLVQPINDAVTMVYDDADNWGAQMSMDITHQASSEYQAKKILDLTDVAAALWDQVQSVRLSLKFLVRDYSGHVLPAANGLDEAIQIIVNGKTHEYPTNAGMPLYKESSAQDVGWWDITIPKAELMRGANEIIVRKAPGKVGDPEAKSDDYLYLAIDLSQQRGNSSVSFDGKEWTQEKLTIPGGNGEYMIRLYLITGESKVQASWRPGGTPALDDPAGLILYAGSRGIKPDAAGLKLTTGQAARVEWPSAAFDAGEPMQISVRAQGPVQLQWLDVDGAAVAEPPIAGLSGSLPAGRTLAPSGLLILAKDAATVQTVTLEGSRSYHPPKPAANIAPIVAEAPQGTPQRPSCRLETETITLTGGHIQAVFDRGANLRLRSLKNLLTKSEMLRHPDDVALFLVEINDQRYAGSRDFKLTSVKPTPNGFIAELEGPNGANLPLAGRAPSGPPSLRAVMTVTMTPDGLRMGMNLVNIGPAPVDFKLAFPHLAGLAISPQPADDYYFYPSGGGIVNTVPAIIRRGYGDYEAMYQVMDLYSPALGCGLSIRADDTEGWHKVLALRKHIPDQGEQNEEKLYMIVKDEYKWKNPLDAVEGTSFAYEYQRRTRAPLTRGAERPGQPAGASGTSAPTQSSFAPAAAVLTVHPGDWHVAMQTYADWAHRVWKFRPFPSQLRSIRNMIAAGWGQGILFKDGKYRTDIITPTTDCIELMSWWEWSELGPFMTPFDQLDKVLTPAQIKRWQPYFVIDPVTGKQMWNNQPGDYRGYNERFGGLPAFQKAVQTYQDMGSLVTLYTDPFRLDENNETGRKHGKEWCVVNREGKLSTGYEVFNPCHQLPDVRQWVAETMGRVMRETKADGIRLDEYGHRGWACYSDQHEHTYQEPGITQWNKSVAEATRLIHAEMDKVRPDLVLTTEHPGYDYLLQYLEGCITYDVSSMRSPLRPLECNLQRFYFPECKAYELDHRGYDKQNRKQFWNTVESFGRHYPMNMYNLLNENEDVYQGRDNYPLFPTLTPHVYANRFRGGGKTMIHLYNATGHTFEGEALRVGASVPDAHVIELLHSEELPVVDGKITLYLSRDDVACVAILPRLLQVNAQGEVQIKDGKGGQVVVANEKGENVLTQDLTGGSAAIDLSKLPDNTKPICLKLLRQGQMVDTAQWPL